MHKHWTRQNPRRKMKARWSRRRPKWRKFGARVCAKIYERHNLKDVEHVMET
jgi:hypothetical protein